jgi:hypothetical protein
MEPMLTPTTACGTCAQQIRAAEEAGNADVMTPEITLVHTRTVATRYPEFSLSRLDLHVDDRPVVLRVRRSTANSEDDECALHGPLNVDVQLEVG